jgi:hypothetical protein
MVSCSLFDPRDPEPPSQSGLMFQPPVSPEIVIQNLRSAIAGKNTPNYMQCFSDPARSQRGFTFIPSANVITQLSDWDREDESNYFSTLVSAADGTSSLDVSGSFPSTSSDTVDYESQYTFTFDHNRKSRFPIVARGSLQFSLEEDDQGRWSIYYWKDIQTSDSLKTWSEFKQEFR